MKGIIEKDFLLKTQTAKRLYHEVAAKQPIIDYHCHLSPEQIATDHTFKNIGELMLAGDHYKWRAIRSFGIDEALVTGDADWREKFRAFATMLPFAIGNPLYHWTHLELARYFNINEPLCAANADKIYDQCTAIMADGSFSTKQLIERSGVEVLCTTDDPQDDLRWHRKIKESGWHVKVLPTFRPDKALNIHKEGFLSYITATGATTLDEVKAWLTARIDCFAAHGCRLSDHGLDFMPAETGDAANALAKALRGEAVSTGERDAYMTELLLHCAREYAKRDWCMQIHVGALRNGNTRGFRKLGPDTGFDSIAETALAAPLAKILDALEMTNELPKTILYSLNPKDNYTLATLMGSFQGAPTRGKIQLGSGWWFNDQKDGMQAQLKALGNLGVLGTFVGMLTDSRSFVSYPRHEYFRRILCDLIGDWVENGEYPDDSDTLATIVKGICYENAKHYFNFN